MVKLISQPTIIEAAGNKPKRIEEYVGRVNTATDGLSIARMVSPSGWVEPAQTPEFDEYTLVLKGAREVRSDDQVLTVSEGQSVVVGRGETVQYSTPGANGAEYVAVCLPAFSPDIVHRHEPEDP